MPSRGDDPKPMAESITLTIILHNHQPVGNFDWVFRNAADDSYIPFLDLLERFTGIRVGLHTTGPLLEWFADNEPTYLDRVRALVDTGRIEILGGAFYEPILSILPDRDKAGQIERMSDWLLQRFGQRPEGFWVAERIWEPGFAGIYADRGLTYTTLDNTHFRYAGVPDDEIWGSYITEDQGSAVRVLPIDYNMRYLIPFHEPEETIAYLAALRDRGVTAVTYADDGEKFGVWPGTKEWVFEKGWLERFFTALEQEVHWIDIALPGDYVRTTPPRGQVYLPTASYREMSGWALPVEAQAALAGADALMEEKPCLCDLKPFIRGGFWRNFLTRYPESNAMYRRMLMVSAEVEQARGKQSYPDAASELYQAQCNCGYWHGVFGGLYLNFLRRAIYEHLIRAEKLAAPRLPPVMVRDHDGDGYDEVILSGGDLTLFLAPRQGGAALELDHRPSAFNCFDTFTRRPELYHADIPDRIESADDGHASIHDGIKAKEDGIRRFLVYDWYRRLSFVDHFIPADETLENFAAARFTELGDFIIEPYEIIDTRTEPAPGAVLERSGALRPGGRELPMTVRKSIALAGRGARVTAGYHLTYPEGAAGSRFGCELNFGLQSGYADDCAVEIPGRILDDSRLASSGVEEDVSEVRLTVGWMPLAITLVFSRPATLWRIPVETVSQSEGGAERTYQNTCLVPLWDLGDPDGAFDVTITLEVSS